MTNKTTSIFDAEKRQKWITFVQRLNPDIEPRAVRLMDEMRMVSHTIYLIGESSLQNTGLSFAQYRVLLSLLFSEEIEGRPELNPSEISERQGTSRNTISGLIRTLEDEGLIERRLDQNDRRKFNIRLSAAGRDLVQRHAHRHMSTIGGCFSSLTSEEQSTLSRLLKKLSLNINAAEKQLNQTDQPLEATPDAVS